MVTVKELTRNLESRFGIKYASLSVEFIPSDKHLYGVPNTIDSDPCRLFYDHSRHVPDQGWVDGWIYLKANFPTSEESFYLTYSEIISLLRQRPHYHNYEDRFGGNDRVYRDFGTYFYLLNHKKSEEIIKSEEWLDMLCALYDLKQDKNSQLSLAIRR